MKNRNQVKLKGQGKTVEAINNFIENLENKVANIRTGRSGDERRTIKSDGGKTTFEIEFDLTEISGPNSAFIQIPETGSIAIKSNERIKENIF